MTTIQSDRVAHFALVSYGRGGDSSSDLQELPGVEQPIAFLQRMDGRYKNLIDFRFFSRRIITMDDQEFTSAPQEISPLYATGAYMTIEEARERSQADELSDLARWQREGYRHAFRLASYHYAPLKHDAEIYVGAAVARTDNRDLWVDPSRSSFGITERFTAPEQPAKLVAA